MNFNDKRVKKAVAVIIMIVIVAMVATTDCAGNGIRSL